ncbi:class I glutamine amidotransferase-like protein [Chaetomidium leptoderma]|uniref:Class I glutamine amidotransferase-like protein n=1 Tax=Chaetomidium leptoderma TaxID=669021 RepID=A0AAN6VHK6_9PEZI|nr:class I glutamine amidotransferase-like protein [Chaetomidium leptoderma]
MAAQTQTQKPFRIAVLLEEVQLSDIISIDIFGNLSQDFLAEISAMDPSFTAFAAHALPIEFFFLATTLEPARVTLRGLKYVPNMTYDACPRDLDLVLVGGPFLTHRPPAAKRFIQEAWPRTRVWMTTCVGSLWLGDAGVLEGLRATTNRPFLGVAKTLLPGTEWLDQRWVVEEKVFEGEGKGELWTAGGAGAGIDMVAQFCLQNWDRKFVYAMALEGLECTPEGTRAQFYTTPAASTTVNFD